MRERSSGAAKGSLEGERESIDHNGGLQSGIDYWRYFGIGIEPRLS